MNSKNFQDLGKGLPEQYRVGTKLSHLNNYQYFGELNEKDEIHGRGIKWCLK